MFRILKMSIRKMICVKEDFILMTKNSIYVRISARFYNLITEIYFTKQSKVKMKKKKKKKKKKNPRQP